MRRALRNVALVLICVLTLLLAYGVLVEPRVILDERRYTAVLPGLAPEQAGTEVAVFSDLQVGMWWANTGMVERVVDRVVEAEPDVVLLPGDFLYSTDPAPAAQIDEVLALLDPLVENGIPTFAVLGNHDYGVGAADELTSALEERGIRVLQNEAVAVPMDDGAGEPLYVVGVGPEAVGLADPQEAVEDVPDGAPRVVMMHHPTSFPELPSTSAPLTVAGHTHCGQVALPGSPRWSYLGLDAEEEIVAEGWAREDYGAEGNRMFVTCGIGFSLVPVRINAPPQLVFFALAGEEA